MASNKKRTVHIDFGKKYGKLTPLEEVTTVSDNGGKHRMIRCRCDCGVEKLISLYSIVEGRSTSCGCTTFKHTDTKVSMHRHGLRNTRLYHIWVDMKQRCYNPNHEAYGRYGGAGITVCDEWRNDPMGFFNWMHEHGYNESLTIDRIDNYKGYCPENCRLATMKEQSRNKKNTRYVVYNGESRLLVELAEEHGVRYGVVHNRIENGWDLEKALTTPEADPKRTFLTVNGETRTIADWSRLVGVKKSTISTRLSNGWSPEKAVLTPTKEAPINNVTYNGETRPLTEWAKVVGIKNSILYKRLNRGWSIEKAFTTPPACG